MMSFHRNTVAQNPPTVAAAAHQPPGHECQFSLCSPTQQQRKGKLVSSREISFASCLAFASLAFMTLCNQSSPLNAADPVKKVSSEDNVPAKTKSSAARDSSVSSNHKAPAQPAWNPAPGRQKSGWSPAASDSSTAPKIRHISASGADETRRYSAPESDGIPADPGAATVPPTTTPTPSLSVREQFLNALRLQREAINGTPRPSSPGSLTIMNSPAATSQNPAPEKHPPQPFTIPSESAVDVHRDSPVSTSPATAARSRIGLTRRLEADLQSDDPYTRESAQRHLRLEMLLLKMKANQAAPAEHPAVNRSSEQPNSATQHASEHLSVEAPATHAPDDHRPQGDHPSIHSPEMPENQNAHVLEDVHPRAETNVNQPPQAEVDHRSQHATIVENSVVDGPIDRLGLANNLFAVGEYPMALEMYQLTSGASLTSQEHFWVEYQIANCLRRMGNPAEASNRHRKLAEHPEAGWLSQQAHWWVANIEKTRLLKKGLAENSYDLHLASVEEVEKATARIQNSPEVPAASQTVQKESNHNEHVH